MGPSRGETADVAVQDDDVADHGIDVAGIVLDEQHSYAHGRLSLQKVGTTREPCCGAPRYKRTNRCVQGIRSIVK